MSAAVILVAGAAWLPAPAAAEFGPLPGAEGFDVTMTRDGAPAVNSGIHPDQMQVHLALNMDGARTDGDLRGLQLDLPDGLIANPAAVEECTQAEFFTPRDSPFEASLSGENCRAESQVGVVAVRSDGATRHFGVFNLVAPYGSAEAIGLAPFGVPMILAGHIPANGSGLSFELRNLSQALGLQALDLTLWGTPWEYKYDVERGDCLNESDPAASHGEPSFFDAGGVFHAGTCHLPRAFNFVHSYLTLPTTCGEQLRWELRATSWQQPGVATASALARDGEGDPLAVGNCIEVLAIPKLQLLTDRAAAATGIVFELDVNDGGGFLNVDGRVRSPIQRVSALLPEGLTINPSLGAGLGVCSEAEFARESAGSAPGSGCPNPSKIGAVGADGPLGLSEPLTGSVFLAQPYANRGGSLIGLYIIASPRRAGASSTSRSGGLSPTRRAAGSPPASRICRRSTTTLHALPARRPARRDDLAARLRRPRRSARVLAVVRSRRFSSKTPRPSRSVAAPTAAPARRRRPPFTRASRRVRSTPTPAPTRPSTCA